MEMKERHGVARRWFDGMTSMGFVSPLMGLSEKYQIFTVLGREQPSVVCQNLRGSTFRRALQPRRGCVLKPMVGPTGSGLPWVGRPPSDLNPERVAPVSIPHSAATPSGLILSFAPFPKVSAAAETLGCGPQPLLGCSIGGSDERRREAEQDNSERGCLKANLG